jgi:S1-C subfamily serine protease
MAEASPPRRFPIFWLAAFTLVGVASGAASGAVVSLLFDDGPASEEASRQAPTFVERRVLVDEESAISDAVAVALPAVVTILNQKADSQDEAGRTIESLAIGTGVIVDERGFVVTNEHVIRDAVRLAVVLSDGEERPAQLVSHDAPFTDLAVLQIPAGGLRPLAFGDSDSLVQGQKVAALGSSIFDFRAAVSEGVVSGTDRRWLRDGIFMENLIQTDAALNAGNSGGPLINTRSEVIGINTNVVRQLGSSEAVFGISFALSSNSITPIIASMIEDGAFPRPYLGVDHLDIDETVAGELGLPVSQGVLVQRVIPEGPAAAADIEAGDILLSIGSIGLGDEMPFINALARLPSAAVVDVQLLRDGQPMVLPVELRPR